MKYPICVLFVVFTFLQACKRGDDVAPAVSHAMITRVVTATSAGGDTTVITYNSDSTISHIIQSGVSGSSLTTYTYISGLIKKVTSYTGNTDTIIDSILLDGQGRPTAAYEMIDVYPLSNTIQYYTYNPAGQLAQTIFIFPNYPFVDTITHVWANGDMVSQTSTEHEHDMSFTFDNTKSCQPGDILYMDHLITSGIIGYPNTHLATGISDGVSAGNVIYSYDSQNRIAGYTSAAGGSGDSEAFTYAP